MKKFNRFGVLIGLLAGAGIVSVIPTVLAQDLPPGPETVIMEDVDATLDNDGPNRIPLPPMAAAPLQGPPDFGPPGGFGPPGAGFGPPGFGPGGPGGPGGPPLHGAASIEGPPPDELMALHGGGELMMLRAAVHGEFTDDQLEKFYKLKTEFEDKAGPKMVEMKSAQRALHDMLTQPEFDRSKALSLQGKINALQADLATMKLERQMGYVNALTAEQRKELRRSFLKVSDFGMGGMMKHRMMRKHMEHHHGGCHKHGGPGAGKEHKESAPTPSEKG